MSLSAAVLGQTNQGAAVLAQTNQPQQSPPTGPQTNQPQQSPPTGPQTNQPQQSPPTGPQTNQPQQPPPPGSQTNQPPTQKPDVLSRLTPEGVALLSLIIVLMGYVFWLIVDFGRRLPNRGYLGPLAIDAFSRAEIARQVPRYYWTPF